MATFNHGVPELTGNTEADLATIYDSYCGLLSQLNYLLNNLDDENINSNFLKGNNND